MVSSRKRQLHEVNNDAPEEPSLLHRIRNQWQFANLCQWIYLFGKVVKIGEEIDVEEIEAQCLNPNSSVLQDIGLALLKFVSSHRGLTPEIFDEYTRRQYLAKAPEKNPFGTEESPAKFAEFDVFTKICVLQQLTQWIMIHPDRVREKMEEQKDVDQTSWRIEPIGWDSEDRSYFVLDDDRLYRLTEAPPATSLPTPKKKSKSARQGSRASKRRRISGVNDTDDFDKPEDSTAPGASSAEWQDDGLGGMKWECIAVTLAEVRQFILTIHKTRDANEKVLRDQLQSHLVPILERQEESRKRRALQREKEILNLAKMANAKRSSRIAGKAEQLKMEEKAKEEEQNRRVEEAAARRSERERLKLEKDRDVRLMSREKRLKEREARRLQHEDELAHLSEDSKNIGGGSGRMSERRLQAEIERNKQALKELEEEDEEGNWIFDCVCGVYGQIDDGTHSVACEKCNIWQHSKCVGILEEEAERPDFHFVCGSCRRREEEPQQRPRPTIKLKVNRPSTASSSANQAQNNVPAPNSMLVVAIPSHPTPSALTAQVADRVTSSETEPPTSNGNHGPISHVHDKKIQPVGQAGGEPIPAILQESVDDSSNHNLSLTEIRHGGPGQPATLTAPVLFVSHGVADRQDSNGDADRNGAISKSQHRPVHGAPVTPGPPSAQLAYQTAKVTQPAATNGLLSHSNTLQHPQSSTSDAQSRTPGSAKPLATPLMAARENGIPGSAQSGALPSAEGGFSPTKHSPPLPRSQPQQATTIITSSTLPSVLPPTATLSPSPRQQILTPPTKSAEPPRRLQVVETPLGSQ